MLPIIKAFTFLTSEYDVIFLDPPYANHNINDIMIQLAKSTLVGNDSTVIAFHSSRTSPQQTYNNFSLMKNKKYGDTAISIYCKETIT